MISVRASNIESQSRKWIQPSTLMATLLLEVLQSVCLNSPACKDVNFKQMAATWITEGVLRVYGVLMNE
jgi:hypothetical protein